MQGFEVQNIFPTILKLSDGWKLPKFTMETYPWENKSKVVYHIRKLKVVHEI